MRLFDLKYVYCGWDDSLIGKEVHYGDSMATLEHEVQNGYTCKGKVVGHNDDVDLPFKVEGITGTVSHWRYVYFDPNFNVKVAYYRDGKQVQFKSKHITDDWQDCSVGPLWDDNCYYRVKPDKSEEPEKHIVPATEFPSLCGYCIHRKDGCIPKSACNCVNFFSTNDDYFRVKKDYVDLVKEHVELERKYGALVSGIQQLMHGPVNC